MVKCRFSTLTVVNERYRLVSTDKMVNAKTGR
jgi:hypothetical protein